MKPSQTPVGVYPPRQPKLLVLFLFLVGLAVPPWVVWKHRGWDLFEPPVLIFMVLLSVGLGLYLGVFRGRKWVTLYEDHLKIEGPVSHFLRHRWGLSLGGARVPFDRIRALGRSAYEGHPVLGKEPFLVVHRKGDKWFGRKFFIACWDNEMYEDLKRQLRGRVPPQCELYTWKEFGRRGPF